MSLKICKNHIVKKKIAGHMALMRHYVMAHFDTTTDKTAIAVHR